MNQGTLLCPNISFPQDFHNGRYGLFEVMCAAYALHNNSSAHSSLQLYGKLKTTAVRLVRRSLLTLTLPSNLPTVSS